MGSIYVSTFKMTSLQEYSQSNTECDLNCSEVAWKNLKPNLSVLDKIYYVHFIVDILQQTPPISSSRSLLLEHY